MYTHTRISPRRLEPRRGAAAAAGLVERLVLIIINTNTNLQANNSNDH